MVKGECRGEQFTTQSYLHCLFIVNFKLFLATSGRVCNVELQARLGVGNGKGSDTYLHLNKGVGRLLFGKI